MGFKYNEIGRALSEDRHRDAAALVVELLAKTKGNQVQAARLVECNDRTMRRWIARLTAMGYDLPTLVRGHMEGQTIDALFAKGKVAEAVRRARRASAA